MSRPADDEDGLALKAAKYLASEIDGNRCDGDGRTADLGLGANALGDRESALKERLERGGDSADFAGNGVRLFDLAEYLGLTDHHRVERGGHAEEVTDGLALAEFIEVGLNR